MIVHFYEPPPSQKTGGLELAIRLLETFLKDADVGVLSNPPLETLGKSGSPEIVHFHGIWQPQYLRISAYCRRVGIPYIVSTHGMLEPWAWRHKWWKKWPWYYLFDRRHLAGATGLMATSDIEALHLRKYFPSSRCESLSIGLTAARKPDYKAARRKLGWSDSEFILLFVSRVHPKKGLHLLLKALANQDETTLYGTRLVIVGGGDASYVQKLREFAKREWKRLPRIDWMGEIWGDEKWAFFQGADLFCLPTFSENFGLAVLEALQVGTRVLTTDQTPWGVVPSWGAGSIVQRQKLAAVIHRNFSWKQVGPHYLRFYESIFQYSR